MVKQLETTLASQSVDECLFEIDSRACSRHSHPDTQIGPFGILQLDNTGGEKERAILPSQDPSNAVEIPDQIDTIGSSSISEFLDPFAPCDFIDGQADALGWSDLFDFSGTSTVPSFPEFATATALPTDNAINVVGGSQVWPYYPPLEQASALPPQALQPSSIGPSFVLDLATSDAQTLLNHYKNKTLDHMLTFPALQKGPWSLQPSRLLRTPHLWTNVLLNTLHSVTYLQS